MPIRYMSGTAMCEGSCGLGEAGPLRQWLVGRRASLIDLGEATHLHTAIVQVLLASAAIVSVEPRDLLLREVLAPVLERSRALSLGTRQDLAA